MPKKYEIKEIKKESKGFINEKRRTTSQPPRFQSPSGASPRSTIRTLTLGSDCADSFELALMKDREALQPVSRPWVVTRSFFTR